MYNAQKAKGLFIKFKYQKISGIDLKMRCLCYQPLKDLEMERMELRKTTMDCVEVCERIMGIAISNSQR